MGQIAKIEQFLINNLTTPIQIYQGDSAEIVVFLNVNSPTSCKIKILKGVETEVDWTDMTKENNGIYKYIWTASSDQVLTTYTVQIKIVNDTYTTLKEFTDYIEVLDLS